MAVTMLSITKQMHKSWVQGSFLNFQTSGKDHKAYKGAEKHVPIKGTEESSNTWP